MGGRPGIVLLLSMGALLLSGSGLSPHQGAPDRLPDGGPEAESGEGTPGSNPAPAQSESIEMGGLLDDALKKLARKKNEQALSKLEAKDYPGALALIQAAYDLDDTNPEIINNFGTIYYLLGNDREAERLLREALDKDNTRFDTHIRLADILGREGETPSRLDEAQALLRKAREMKGNRADVILKQARVAQLQGADDDAERYFEAYVRVLKPTDPLKIEIGDFFRDRGRTDEALSWYQRVRGDGEFGKEAAGRIWDIELERQAKRFGWSLGPDTIPTKARTLAGKGQVQLNRGRFDEAQRLLVEAVALAPGFARARMHLGDVYRATDRLDAAELAFLRALAMEDNADTCFRLGTLYLEDTQPPRAAEAALFLSRALDYRPDWTDLRFSLARALRTIGDMAGAGRQLDLFLASPVEGSKREAALALKQTLGDLNAPVQGAAMRNGLPVNSQDAELAVILGRARVHLVKGRPEAAMAELRGVPKAKRGTAVLNLEAQILFASGRQSEAKQRLEHSLRLNGNQGGALEQMGIVQLALGDRDRAAFHFERAQALGVTSARYHLACLQVPRGGSALNTWIHSLFHFPALLRARSELGSFLRQAAPSAYRADGEAFHRDLTSRVRVATISYVVVVVLILALLVGLRIRRTRGQGLAAMMEAHPESGADVQRILFAIRHEILKHNTLVLGGLIEAMDENEAEAGAKAAHFAAILRGSAGREPMHKRLDFYADELSKVGRAYKFQLNLKYRDPAIGALIKGFDLLCRVSPYLGEYDSLKSGSKQKLRSTLGAAAQLLIEIGYAKIEQLLDGVRSSAVRPKDIEEIAESVQSEPGFANAPKKPVTVTSEIQGPVDLSLPRQVFEDILANLIRNALQSGLECGVHVKTEVDAITGIERAVFSVRDKSDRDLDLASIQERNIEGGLGLTAALVSRHDGALDVVREGEPWKKSVRVTFNVAATR